MNDAFWMLAGSWVIVLQHLSGKYPDPHYNMGISFDDLKLLGWSYLLVLFQIGVFFVLLNLVL